MAGASGSRASVKSSNKVPPRSDADRLGGLRERQHALADVEHGQEARPEGAVGRAETEAWGWEAAGGKPP